MIVRDDIDREHLRQMLETRGWQMIERAILEMAQQRLQSLRQDLDQRQTDKVRGFLDALDAVLRLPKRLLKPENTYPKRQ